MWEGRMWRHDVMRGPVELELVRARTAVVRMMGGFATGDMPMIAIFTFISSELTARMLIFKRTSNQESVFFGIIANFMSIADPTAFGVIGLERFFMLHEYYNELRGLREVIIS